jgi:hypothetical protein
MKVGSERLHDIQAGAYGVRRVVAALELVQHPADEDGLQENLLVTQTPYCSRRASGFAQTCLPEVISALFINE